MSETTLYHNPRCSKSRQALALLHENKLNPNIVHYLKTPLTHAQLRTLLKQLDATAAEVIRRNEPAFKAHTFSQHPPTEQELFQLLLEHPIVLERPIVVHQGRAVIARPPEKLLELL